MRHNLRNPYILDCLARKRGVHEDTRRPRQERAVDQDVEVELDCNSCFPYVCRCED